MQRTRGHLALTALLVLVIGQTAVAQGEGGTTSFESDDGLATLVVPSGAVPEGTDITISYRSPEEAPPELSDRTGAGSPSHYLVEPMDIAFDPPARFIRQVPLTMLDRYADDPQVLGMLAIRDDAGAWSWASDLGFVIDAAAEALVLSGDITSGGSVFALGTGVVAPPLAERDYVGEDYVSEGLLTETWFSVQRFLGLPSTYEGHGASITAAVGTTADADVATVGEARMSAVDDALVVSLPLECVGPGETSTGLTFTLEGVGDDVLIASWLELPAATVEVSLGGFIECLEW